MKPLPLVPALVLFLLSTPFASADFETPTLITGGTIVRAPGQPPEAGWVLIDKGRIIGVGTGTPIDGIPANAEPFDATGMIIYPGFIDANTHLGMTKAEPSDDEQSRVEDENPDVRQGPQSATVQAYRRLMHPRWRVAEMYDPISGGGSAPAAPRGGGGGGRGGRDEAPSAPDEKDIRAEHRSAGFTAALVSPKPVILSGVSAVVSLGDLPVRRSILSADFAQHSAFVTGIDRGDFAAAFDRPRYPTTTMGAMAAFRQIFLDAEWQRRLADWRTGDPVSRRIPFDPDLDAINDLYERNKGFVRADALPVVFVANSENEIHRALDMAAEFKLTPIIAGAREGWKVASRLKQLNVPVIVSLKWSEDPEETSKNRKAEKPKPESGRSENESAKSTQPGKKKLFDDEWETQAWEPAKVFDEKKRLWGEEVDNLKRLNESGVTVAIGTFELKSVADAMKNLQKAIERGLPEQVALAALTTTPATLLKQQASLGEIAIGKSANLTMFSKPIADKEAKVRGVFVDGKHFDIDDKGPDGGAMGRGRRGSGGRRGDRGPRGEADDEAPPTSAPASQPAEPIKRPVFAAETEADRKNLPKTNGTILLRNATVLPVSGEPLAETDLLVRDGKIAEIGKNIAAPAGAMTADLKGYYIAPGIIDPHSHICSDGGLNEFSLSVTCEVRVKDVIDHTDISAYRGLAGGVTCVHTMHGSANTIGGQNAVLRLKYGKPAAEWIFKEAPQTVKFALGENVKQSNSDRRSRGTRFPNTRAGVEAVIRRSFDAALAYRAETADFEKEKAAGKQPRPLRRDLRLDALASIIDGSIWVHSHCYRADEIVRLLTVAESYGFRIAVLQHVLEGYRLIPEMFRHGASASTFSDWWAYKIEAWEAIPHNAARMEQGGVVATINSDSAEVMRHLNLEAAKCMRFGGLPANEALRLCTLNGAIQLGIEKYVGSIEIGKFADLAVFNGHPLDTTARCVLTLIDGEVYFKHADLDLAQPPAPRPAMSFTPSKPTKSLTPLPGDDYWLVGGTVHPVSGESITNGAVHFKAGLLEYVGPRPEEARLRGAALMDTTGLHIYPGLVNAGASLGIEEIQSVQGTIDTAEIADFQPDLQAVWAYNPFSAIIEVARCEGITSTMVFQSGGNVSSRTGVVHLDGWSMAESLVTSPVALRVELPSLPVEFPPDMQEDRKAEAKRNHRKRLTAIEEYFDKAAHYAKVSRLAKEKPELTPKPDAQLDAMIPYITGEAPVLLSANSYKQIREALEFARRYKLRPILFGGREAWKLADELAKEKVDVIFSRTTSYPASAYEPWDSVYTSPAVLDRAGVRFCIAVNDAELSKQIGVEAGLSVAYGLSDDVALRAITTTPAQILGIADKVGSLETGKSADVIVCTDSPLQAANVVVAEFIAGKPIDLTSKHTRNDDMFRRRPAPNLGPEPSLRGPKPMRLKAG